MKVFSAIKVLRFKPESATQETNKFKTTVNQSEEACGYRQMATHRPLPSPDADGNAIGSSIPSCHVVITSYSCVQFTWTWQCCTAAVQCSAVSGGTVQCSAV
jgi:hypothetical protein